MPHPASLGRTRNFFSVSRWDLLASPRQVRRNGSLYVVATPMVVHHQLCHIYHTTASSSLTFVELHPSRKANSCASNSPNPSIIPFTKGNTRLIAAPLINDHIVGGWYIITGCSPLPLLFDDDCGGLDEGGERDEYGSESEGIVRPEAERSRDGEGERSIARSVVLGGWGEEERWRQARD